ncbi:MAG: hypothetical protein IJ863_03575 [Spirochaetales bacterium]|nr:hypothetical protein [Spirochaetales bacterium]
MKKNTVILAVAMVLCLVLAQSAFAADGDYPSEFRPLEVKDGYTLEEAFWFNPTLYAADVLQFTQAYMLPEDPVTFYMIAAGYTDDQIEETFVIYQSFFEPDYVGYVNFNYSCDVEAFAESVGYEFDPEGSYTFSILFEEVEDLVDIFPRGIGRANSYDTFRRAALQLAFYAKKNGTTPGYQVCYDYIQQILAYYQEQFDAAMEAEAAATAATEETTAE